jgi:hypothetical protein
MYRHIDLLSPLTRLLTALNSESSAATQLSLQPITSLRMKTQATANREIKMAVRESWPHPAWVVL